MVKGCHQNRFSILLWKSPGTVRNGCLLGGVLLIIIDTNENKVNPNFVCDKRTETKLFVLPDGGQARFSDSLWQINLEMAAQDTLGFILLDTAL